MIRDQIPLCDLGDKLGVRKCAPVTKVPRTSPFVEKLRSVRLATTSKHCKDALEWIDKYPAGYAVETTCADIPDGDVYYDTFGDLKSRDVEVT